DHLPGHCHHGRLLHPLRARTPAPGQTPLDPVGHYSPGVLRLSPGGAAGQQYRLAGVGPGGATPRTGRASGRGFPHRRARPGFLLPPTGAVGVEPRRTRTDHAGGESPDRGQGRFARPRRRTTRCYPAGPLSGARLHPHRAFANTEINGVCNSIRPCRVNSASSTPAEPRLSTTPPAPNTRTISLTARAKAPGVIGTSGLNTLATYATRTAPSARALRSLMVPWCRRTRAGSEASCARNAWNICAASTMCSPIHS